MKQILIGVLAVVAIIGGAIIFGKDSSVKGVLSSHTYGGGTSGVTLVEYGDFECPACKFFYPIVEQVKEKYKDKITFQFKNLPLVQIHRNALAAHRAAEAASKQDKFWEMYSLIYSRQEDWNGPSQTDPVGVTTPQAISYFEGYAEELGLNIEKFKLDVDLSEVTGTINADTSEAKDLGVSGTPAFFLDGKQIEDSTTIDSLEKFSVLIDQAIAAKATPTN